MTKVLWIQPQRFTVEAKAAIQGFLIKRNISPSHVFYIDINAKMQKPWIQKSQKVRHFNWAEQGKVEAYLLELCKRLNTKIIVCNDENLCQLFTGNRSLYLCNGFVYRWKHLPVLVMDEMSSVHKTPHGSWLNLSNFSKLRRWLHDEQRPEPAFDYHLCKTVQHLRELLLVSRTAIVSSCDLETAGSFITSCSFTFLSSNGSMPTYVIPLYSTLHSDGCYWRTEEEFQIALETMKEVCENDVPMVFQNGQYDASWFLRYRIALNNYFLDTLHMFHSIWPFAPKKLNNITAYCCDFAMFWKDESKSERNDVKKYGRVPWTREGLEKYWRYNGLDTHYTMLSVLFLLRIFTHNEMAWAVKNYGSEFEDQVGPAMTMSMRGLQRSYKRWQFYKDKLGGEHEAALKKLRVMCDDPEFNPQSDYQVQSLLYDVLGVKPIQARGGKHKKQSARSVDKRMLRIAKTQHPLFAKYIDAIHAVKETRNNYSKYIDLYCPDNRFLYNLWSAGTPTFRYAGQNHAWWYGTNPQNIPANMRDMFVADEGYFFFDPDYSQSDAWFIAFESQDENMIEELVGPDDAHCLLAAEIFKKPYEDIYKGYINDEDWVTDAIEGVRQTSKRTRHGANYRMAGYTLYILMGREAVVATARALGYKDAHMWNEKLLSDLCTKLIRMYYQRYHRVEKWYEESVDEVIANGNRAVSFDGHSCLFFGNLKKDMELQRKLSSFYGQGGTGANVRRVLLEYFYETGLEKEGVRLHLQNHDSLLFGIPWGRFDLCRNILTLMNKECTIRGRSFIVPTDAKCGLSWGRSMMKFSDDTTMEKIVENERRWEEKRFNGFRKEREAA